MSGKRAESVIDPPNKSNLTLPPQGTNAGDSHEHSVAIIQHMYSGAQTQTYLQLSSFWHLVTFQHLVQAKKGIR